MKTLIGFRDFRTRLLVGLSLIALLSGRATEAMDNKLGLTADLTWASQYVTDGFRVGQGDPVVQPSVAWSVLDSGLSLIFWSAIPIDRRNQRFDEYDFMAHYRLRLFEGSGYSMVLRGFYDYWIYPKSEPLRDSFGTIVSSEKKQGNKLHAGISWPSLLPVFDSHLVPSYNLYYWLYWDQNRKDRFQGGARHELLLEYHHLIPKLIPGTQGQYAGVSAGANYHDGFLGVPPGWSHTVAQLMTHVYALDSLFSLRVNYQWSYQKSVNPDNELWSSLSLTKTF
jgi:hypothetical protein